MILKHGNIFQNLVHRSLTFRMPWRKNIYIFTVSSILHMKKLGFAGERKLFLMIKYKVADPGVEL